MTQGVGDAIQVLIHLVENFLKYTGYIPSIQILQD